MKAVCTEQEERFRSKQQRDRNNDHIKKIGLDLNSSETETAVISRKKKGLDLNNNETQTVVIKKGKCITHIASFKREDADRSK